MESNNQERIDRLKKLHDRGLSYRKIASIEGISRSRVHQLVSGYKSPASDNRYDELRKFVFMLDENKCQKCGAVEDLVMHHLDGDDRNNDTANLVTLCPSCHAKVHHKKGDITRTEKKERNARIIAYRNRGYKLISIARMFKISIGMVHRIVSRNNGQERT
jgi:transposase